MARREPGGDRPGWTRFSAAEDMLQQVEAQQKEKQKTEFQAFVSKQQAMPANAADREALFQQFLQWQESRTH